MRVLVDTNVLTRLIDVDHPSVHIARDALHRLRQRGDETCIASQCLYEFWVVATRPKTVNGLGMTVAQTLDAIAGLESLFEVHPDVPGIYSRWRELIERHAVAGKRAHDARLVATMIVHGINAVLTFNGPDFARYAEVEVLDPATLT